MTTCTIVPDCSENVAYFDGTPLTSMRVISCVSSTTIAQLKARVSECDCDIVPISMLEDIHSQDAYEDDTLVTTLISHDKILLDAYATHGIPLNNVNLIVRQRNTKSQHTNSQSKQKTVSS